MDLHMSTGQLCSEQSCMPGNFASHDSCSGSASFANNDSTCAGNAGNSEWQWNAETGGGNAQGCKAGMSESQVAACSLGETKVQHPGANGGSNWPSGCANAWGNFALAGVEWQIHCTRYLVNHVGSSLSQVRNQIKVQDVVAGQTNVSNSSAEAGSNKDAVDAAMAAVVSVAVAAVAAAALRVVVREAA